MIPLSTTRFTVHNMVETEPGEGRTPVVLHRNVHGHVSSPRGLGVTQAGGGRAEVDAVILCDRSVAVPITARFTDETTGEAWEVVWCDARRGLGMDHLVVGVNRVVGVAA